MKTVTEEEITKSKMLELYKNKIYLPEHDDDKSIFYFVREPSLQVRKPSQEEYISFIKFMEGSAKSVKIESFCYEGVLAIDGSFEFPVSYNDVIDIKVADKSVKTLYY